MVVKESFTGAFFTACRAALDKATTVDCTSGLAQVLAIKDASELTLQRTASIVAYKVMHRTVGDVVRVLQKGRKVENQEVSDSISNFLADDGALAKLSPPAGVCFVSPSSSRACAYLRHGRC